MKNNNNDKKIVCNICKCEKEDDGKIKVTCSNCNNDKDMTIICKSCNCIDSKDEYAKVCLKDCICEGQKHNNIYITCTEFEEDLN